MKRALVFFVLFSFNVMAFHDPFILTDSGIRERVLKILQTDNVKKVLTKDLLLMNPLLSYEEEWQLFSSRKYKKSNGKVSGKVFIYWEILGDVELLQVSGGAATYNSSGVFRIGLKRHYVQVSKKGKIKEISSPFAQSGPEREYCALEVYGPKDHKESNESAYSLQDDYFVDSVQPTIICRKVNSEGIELDTIHPPRKYTFFKEFSESFEVTGVIGFYEAVKDQAEVKRWTSKLQRINGLFYSILIKILSSEMITDVFHNLGKGIETTDQLSLENYTQGHHFSGVIRKTNRENIFRVFMNRSYSTLAEESRFNRRFIDQYYNEQCFIEVEFEPQSNKLKLVPNENMNEQGVTCLISDYLPGDLDLDGDVDRFDLRRAHKIH